MLFLLPEKYRRIWWLFVLCVGALILGVGIVLSLVHGAWSNLPYLIVPEAIFIAVIVRLFRKIRELFGGTENLRTSLEN